MVIGNESTDRTRLGFTRRRKISTHASGIALRRFGGGNVSALIRSGASADRRSSISGSPPTTATPNSNRQPHGKSGPDIFLARHFNRPAVRLDNGLGNRQAKTGVACAGARLVGAKKSSKHAAANLPAQSPAPCPPPSARPGRFAIPASRALRLRAGCIGSRSSADS